MADASARFMVDDMWGAECSGYHLQFRPEADVIERIVSLQDHIEKRLHSDLGLRFAVELVPEDALMEWSNRGREGKPRRILDHRFEKK